MRGNGAGRRWILVRDKRFLADRERLVADYPRLAGVFRVTERELEAIPTYRGIDLGSGRWLHVTRAAAGAPPLVYFYEVKPSHRVVWLGGVDLNR